MNIYAPSAVGDCGKKSDVWQQLFGYRKNAASQSIRKLVEQPDRFGRASLRLGDVLLDFSKTGIDDTAKALLVQLAAERFVERRRDEMFSGAPINASEGRAVLHTALRGSQSVFVDGQNILPAVSATLERMRVFARELRTGQRLSVTNEQFTDVINIGIGGSDLGPKMVVRALTPYSKVLNVHFISNIDPSHAADVLEGLDPARTLVIIASKTFTTLETMTNAQVVRGWMESSLGERAVEHFVAVSSAREKARAFGIDADRIFWFCRLGRRAIFRLGAGWVAGDAGNRT